MFINKKYYKNWFVHNCVGHPLAEIVFRITKNSKLSQRLHDGTLPIKITNPWPEQNDATEQNKAAPTIIVGHQPARSIDRNDPPRSD